MDENRILGSMEKGGFGTSVNFDIDDAPMPVRRRKNQFWLRAGAEIVEKIGLLGLTPQEFGARTKQLFDEFDADESGTIDLNELSTAINELGLDFNDTQIEEIFSSVDHTDEGEIDFKHFEKLLLILLQQSKSPQSAHNACPGCGAEIEHGEWLDCLVGFVSGAHAHVSDSPVKARIVQTLRNEVQRMQVPHPIDDWELAVVERLNSEIARIVQAEVTRVAMENNSAEHDENIRRQAYIDAQEEIIPILTEQIRQQVEAELAPRIEIQLRQQLEAEMWDKFEAEWRQRSSQE